MKNENQNVTERIKTIEDVLKDHGLTMEQVDAQFKGVPEHFKFQHLAELLCASLNEGWKPDWSDWNQHKYFPWFEMKGSSGFRFGGHGLWLAASRVGSRLCLKSYDLVHHIGEHFTDLYEKFMIEKQAKSVIMNKTRRIHKRRRFKAILKWLWVRPKGILMLLFYKQVGVIAIGRPVINKEGDLQHQVHSSNNLRGKLIYIVPIDPHGIGKVIKNLQNIQRDLIHKSKHHDGVTMRKLKGGKR